MILGSRSLTLFLPLLISTFPTSTTRCPPPLSSLLRLNGQPYIENESKEVMLKREVGEVVGSISLLLSPFLSSLRCSLHQDPGFQFSYFGVRQVVARSSLGQEECQLYFARSGLAAARVNLTVLVEAEQAEEIEGCTQETTAQVGLTVQFCSRRDYDICGLEAARAPAEEPRHTGGEFDEFPEFPVTNLGPEFPGGPLLPPALGPGGGEEVLTLPPDTGEEEWEGEFAPVDQGEGVEEVEVDQGEGMEEVDTGERGFRTEEPKLSTEQGVVAVPVTGDPSMAAGESGDALLDRIGVVLFSPDTTPITIAVLTFLLLSSLAGLACLYCRGRHRDRKLRQLRSFISRSPSTCPSSSTSTTTCPSSDTTSSPSTPSPSAPNAPTISPNNLPKITLPLSRQPRMFDDNMVMYFQEVSPPEEREPPRTLVTRRSWTAAQDT